MQAVECALRPGNICAADGKPEILQSEAICGKTREIGLDTHRRPYPALDRDVTDTSYFREALPHQRISEIAERAQRDSIGCQR